MVSSMAPTTGRVAVVLPQAAMSRTGVEALIRRSFVEADLVEAVIGLAPNLFYGTTIAANVMVLRSTKGPDRRGKILMVDGEALFKKGRNQNSLDADHVDLLASAYRSPADIDSVSKVVSLAEVKANDFNLSVPLYISRKPRGIRMEVGPAVADLVDAHARTRTARDEVTRHLAEWALS
jgi:type I restriction enzyme M protein